MQSSPSLQTAQFAIVGCGQIGRLHAERLRDDPRARIVALFDPDPETVRRVQSEFAPQSRLCSSFEELLATEGLQAVAICTPTSLHFEQVLAARERGLHVLCEKPLADTRERIAALVAAAARGGPLLSVAYQRRHAALYRTLRREVLSGRWGPVRAVASHNTEHWQQTQALPGMWRDDPRINPGGFIGDAGSHKIDIVFFTTGLRPLEVFAQSDRCGSQVEINTTVSARLVNGAALSMSFVGNAHHFWEVLHVACAEADWIVRDGALWLARGNQVEKFTALEPESQPIAAFLDCLTQGAADAAPAACALPVFNFTHAVLESARTGRCVSISETPLSEETVTPD
jgi:predicted dehydrogenase